MCSVCPCSLVSIICFRPVSAAKIIPQMGRVSGGWQLTYRIPDASRAALHLSCHISLIWLTFWWSKIWPEKERKRVIDGNYSRSTFPTVEAATHGNRHHPKQVKNKSPGALFFLETFQPSLHFSYQISINRLVAHPLLARDHVLVIWWFPAIRAIKCTPNIARSRFQTILFTSKNKGIHVKVG